MADWTEYGEALFNAEFECVENKTKCIQNAYWRDLQAYTTQDWQLSIQIHSVVNVKQSGILRYFFDLKLVSNSE